MTNVRGDEYCVLPWQEKEEKSERISQLEEEAKVSSPPSPATHTRT